MKRKHSFNYGKTNSRRRETYYTCVLSPSMLLAVNNKCQGTSKEVTFRVSVLKRLTIQVERKSLAGGTILTRKKNQRMYLIPCETAVRWHIGMEMCRWRFARPDRDHGEMKTMIYESYWLMNDFFWVWYFYDDIFFSLGKFERKTRNDTIGKGELFFMV